ncbi:hypothetical protein GCM10022219_06630 [Microbacterium oryzae]|uniref:VanZ family protein n=1 Tax=Microbacterium oryzae TaxID=743009 RepID=A0A6I6DPC5_9MICO|nr:VanZ family protein [Microbacterium oryzae]QGU26765.1 VanZ family protein [Microbacterium oryzae]
MSSNPFGEVPVLPVAVPFGVVVFVIQLVFLLRRGRFTWPRAAVAAAISVYAAGVFANTVFPIFLNPPPNEEPWAPALALIPFHDYELADALTNVVVFVPLGILIPLLMRRPSWWKTLLTAAVVSLTIELLQLAAQRLFSGGHVADINDFIWNTVGGVVGYVIFVVLTHAPILSAVVDRFRWHSAAGAAHLVWLARSDRPAAPAWNDRIR